MSPSVLSTSTPIQTPNRSATVSSSTINKESEVTEGRTRSGTLSDIGSRGRPNTNALLVQEIQVFPIVSFVRNILPG